ncbi:MAG: sigma 54-interacting transcriptional regulator [Deltaproteobacteria bacterium]|nr:sigma 54-interacting transcriptional regulator [Deltaproteobacteria bacterium]
MKVVLELAHAGRVVLRRPIEHGALLVGRNPECDLNIPDESVAPEQCLVQRAGPNVTLVNRGPSGTQVGEEIVHEALQLADGDRITLGHLAATVRFVHEEAPASRTRSLAPERAGSDTPLWVSAPDAHPGKRWSLSASELRVGSDLENDIVLADPFASAFHARFWLENGRCMVGDAGSHNGVFVRGHKIREGEVPLAAQVRLGKTILMVTAESSSASFEPTLDWRLVGSSPASEAVRDLVYRVAETDAPVLITGETGTGKEVVARLLVEVSPRAGRPFVPLNCGALSPNLVASELYGHERGAFTGAVARHQGAFAAAHGGTLFLDEIGELPLELQPQLLRAIETGEVRAVGSSETSRVNVRVVAATHRKLEEDVAAGRFREDLYHRLNVLTLTLPPLRERQQDILELADYFVALFAPAQSAVTLGDDAKALLVRHPWPGNVRELRNVIQRAVLMRRQDVLSASDLVFAPSAASGQPSATGRTLGEIEREAIIAALRRHAGNKKETAAALGISRSTVHRKIEELGIDIDAVLRGERG